MPLKSRGLGQRPKRRKMNSSVRSPSRDATKILWILKEAYDNPDGSGGGWNFCDIWEEKGRLWDSITRHDGRATWQPIIYVCYAILNGFKTYDEMPYIRNKPEMADVLKSIAFININKLPGLSRSNDTQILDFYQKNKIILKKQIEVFQPDIIIGYYKIKWQLCSDLNVPVINEQTKSSCHYIKTPDRLFIFASHPAQTKKRRQIYVNEIVEAAKDWSGSRETI
jgi:hypothetical protein